MDACREVRLLLQLQSKQGSCIQSGFQAAFPCSQTQASPNPWDHRACGIYLLPTECHSPKRRLIARAYNKIGLQTKPIGYLQIKQGCFQDFILPRNNQLRSPVDENKHFRNINLFGILLNVRVQIFPQFIQLHIRKIDQCVKLVKEFRVFKP